MIRLRVARGDRQVEVVIYERLVFVRFLEERALHYNDSCEPRTDGRVAKTY